MLKQHDGNTHWKQTSSWQDILTVNQIDKETEKKNYIFLYIRNLFSNIVQLSFTSTSNFSIQIF